MQNTPAFPKGNKARFPIGIYVYTFVLSVCFCAYFFICKSAWNSDYWSNQCEKGFDGMFDVTAALIKYNWSSFPRILVYAVLPLVLIVSSICLFNELTDKKHSRSYLCAILLLAVTVVSGVFFIISPASIENAPSVKALFFVNFSSKVFWIAFFPTCTFFSEICWKCGVLGMKKLVKTGIESSREYIPGGTQTVSMDIKDDHENKIGTIEIQRPYEGHYTDNYHTVEVEYYVCENCGAKSKRKKS